MDAPVARNDTTLIDGIIAQRIEEKVPSGDRGEVFEYFTFQQVLKNYDLSQDEIEAGWVDGRDDGGIDGFFVFVNGHLISEVSTFQWPKTRAQVDVFVISCKHHDTFREATLNTIVASVQELFDLSRDPSSFSGAYSRAIIAARARFVEVYKRVAITDPEMNFNFIYASRGDTEEVGDSVRARSHQIVDTVSAYFSKANAQFAFLGSGELIERFRNNKQFSLELPFLDCLSGKGEGYIALVRLGDYFKFVSDDHGNLRRYLFDSNVRDYLGESKVNDDIADSLEDESVSDFWWLNNGVTILATRAIISGRNILLQDIQIVNGLQTTETVHRHFSGGSEKSKDRSLAVKIVVSRDDKLRDQIIRATNNQNAVEQAALHATDKIQRDIEQILERHDWYYERRKNYYRNIGRPPARFVTPLYLASGCVALVLKNTVSAAVLRSRFMRSESKYATVFSDKRPIEVWPIIVSVLKATEEEMLRAYGQHGHYGERFLRSWRGLIGFLFVSRFVGRFDYKIGELLSIKFDENSREMLGECVNFVLSRRGEAVRPSFFIVKEICSEFTKRHSLLGIDAIYGTPFNDSILNKGGGSNKISPEFIEQVNVLLPHQPWPPGIHIEIAGKLDCKPVLVSMAIRRLMEAGRRYEQVDGVVFDREGNVVATGSEVKAGS